MVGNLDVAFDVLLACGDVGEDGGEEVIRAHELNLRRNLLSAPEAKQGQGSLGIPTPASGEDRRSQSGLFQNWLHTLGKKILKKIGNWKDMLLCHPDIRAGVRA